MIIIANIVALLVLFWFFSSENGPFKKITFWLGLGYKVFAGILLGLIYFYYIKAGDTLVYFEEAKEIASHINSSFSSYLERLFINTYPQHKGEYRTEFFTKILSLFMIITANNYWLTSVYLSFFSFLGSWFLMKTIAEHYPELKIPAFIGFVVTPSVVFWSSGIMKEAVANAGFFLLGTFLIRFYNRQPISLLAHIGYAFVLILVIKLRFYLGAVMIIAIGFLIISGLLIKLSSRFSRYLLITTLTIGVILGASYMDYNLQFNNLPESIHLNYETISKSSAKDNSVSFDLLPNWLSVIMNSPKSLLYGLFGPFPGQGHLSSMIYWFENVVLLSLAVWSLYILVRSQPKVRIDLVSIVAISYILIMATLLPMVAPNFGTMMRYKSAFLPILWTILLYLPHRRSSGINLN